MSKNPFTQATRENVRLRLGLYGPPGSGKTWSALAIAQAIGMRVAVIDSESGSASRYADAFDFDVLELTSCHPQRYVEAIRAACEAGYDVIVIDSLTHAWSGLDGVLEQVDRESAAKRGNSFAAWQKGTPLHRQLLQAILSSKAHVIATMRAKTVWRMEQDEHGKRVPVADHDTADQRKDVGYEFDVVGAVDAGHAITIEKTRASGLDGQVFDDVAKLAADLATWLDVPLLGWEHAEPSVRERLSTSGMALDQVVAFLADTGRGDLLTLSPRRREDLVEALCRRKDAKAAFTTWLAEQPKPEADA